MEKQLQGASQKQGTSVGLLMAVFMSWVCTFVAGKGNQINFWDKIRILRLLIFFPRVAASIAVFRLPVWK